MWLEHGVRKVLGMTTISVRPATLDDHGTVAKLVHELGVDDPEPTPEDFTADWMPTTLIAERGERSLGYTFFRPMKEVVHLAHIVAAPEARRQGVGRALLTEVVRRARGAGCRAMTLNVRPTNTAAIRLYESFGLAATHRNVGLKLAWAHIDALSDDEAPLAKIAREIDPGDDEELEAEWSLPKGMLAEARTRPGRVLWTVRSGTAARSALAVFHPAFPGTSPFRAPDMAHALSLLRALRPFARPEDALVHMMIEDQLDLAEGLIRVGATMKIETTFMRGPL